MQEFFNKAEASCKVLRANDLDPKDVEILKRLLKSRLPLTQIFGALKYSFITMWHIINLYSNNLYYYEYDDVILIVSETDSALNIIDVIYTEPFDFILILKGLIHGRETKLINFHFPPDQLEYDCHNIDFNNRGLFVKGNFKIDSDDFLFPTTAIT